MFLLDTLAPLLKASYRVFTSPSSYSQRYFPFLQSFDIRDLSFFWKKKIKRMTFFSFHFAQWNLRKSTTLSRLNKAVKICIIKNRYRRNQIGMSKEMCMDEIIGQCGDVHRHRSGKGRDGQGWEGNEEIGTEEMGMDKDERAMRGLTRRRWTRRRQWGDWHLHRWQHKEELGMGREKRAKRKWAWAGRNWAGRN